MANLLLDENPLSSMIDGDVAKMLQEYQAQQERVARLKAAVAQAHDPTLASSPSLTNVPGAWMAIPARGAVREPRPEGVPSVYSPARPSDAQQAAAAAAINQASDARVRAMDRLHQQKMDNIQGGVDSAFNVLNSMGQPRIGSDPMRNPLVAAAAARAGILGSSPSNPLSSVAGLTNGARGWVSDGNSTALVQAPLAGPGQAGLDRVAEAKRILNETGVSRQVGTYAPTRSRPMVGDYAPGALEAAKEAQKAYRDKVAANAVAKAGRVAAFREKQSNPLAAIGSVEDNPMAVAQGLVRMGLNPQSAVTMSLGLAERSAKKAEQDNAVRAEWAKANPETRKALEGMFPNLLGDASKKFASSTNTLDMSKLRPEIRAKIVDANGNVIPGMAGSVLRDPKFKLTPDEIPILESIRGPVGTFGDYWSGVGNWWSEALGGGASRPAGAGGPTVPAGVPAPRIMPPRLGAQSSIPSLDLTFPTSY